MRTQAEVRVQSASSAGGLRRLYVTDRRLVLCHMAEPLYPALQFLLFIVAVLTTDTRPRMRIAAVMLILAVPVLRGCVRFRRIDQVLPLAEIEAVRPTVGADPRGMVLWLRGGTSWLLLRPRLRWLLTGPNAVGSFQRARKMLNELVAGGGAVR